MRPLDARRLELLIDRFIDEDVGRGDVTTESLIPEGARGSAHIEVRRHAIVAGLDAARTCFERVGGAIRWRALADDGDQVATGTVVARVEGSMRAILTAERTALNLLGRLSGIATLTREFVDALQGTPVRVVDTRKTTPGMRLLEKHAVRAGGARNHRFGLDDGILIKDNHLAAVGGITEAVTRMREVAPHGLLVEVEVQDLAGLDAALAAGAQAILLDNMTPELVREAVVRAGGKALLEASGGITLDNVRSYAEAGVDLISIGALTHSAPAIDVSLEVHS
ncbi:MAG: carboxylating nicotinate-nucleotide diphosphorylase [Actinomycetota bacterium]|nr:carboxylating nicotinate-nucleotide diphosphorylase [Actinomycetota bacterium]